MGKGDLGRRAHRSFACVSVAEMEFIADGGWWLGWGVR